MLSGRGLCDGLITRPEESYRLWRVVVCDQENLENEEAKFRNRAVENTTTMGYNTRKTNNKQTNKQTNAEKLDKRQKTTLLTAVNGSGHGRTDRRTSLGEKLPVQGSRRADIVVRRI
jgi:hypothetical protein